MRPLISVLLVASLFCIACPQVGPRHLADMKELWLDANVPPGSNLVSILLRCDWHASGGCAELGRDFHATLNGVEVLATASGTITETGDCAAPAVAAQSTAGATQLSFVIVDSSKQVEFDVANPFAADVAVTRCVGATHCDFAGPLRTATLTGTP